jgi:hypothetical protein
MYKELQSGLPYPKCSPCGDFCEECSDFTKECTRCKHNYEPTSEDKTRCIVSADADLKMTGVGFEEVNKMVRIIFEAKIVPKDWNNLLWI